MMKRTVRKHGANFTAVGRDLRRQIAADILRHQHDRTRRIAQHGFVGRIRNGSLAKRGKIGLKREHHCERLFGPLLARA